MQTCARKAAARARMRANANIRIRRSAVDIFEALFTRRSIRSFTAEDVSEEDLDMVLRAAMAAPSAHNSQPWHFVVVRDAEARKAVAARHPYAKMAADAPVVIAVCADPAECKEEGFWQQDCSAALENILLAARGRNLGTVWCGMHPVEDRVEPVREILGIPAGINILGLVVMGHPAQPFRKVDRYKAEKIHFDRW